LSKRLLAGWVEASQIKIGANTLAAKHFGGPDYLYLINQLFLQELTGKNCPSFHHQPVYSKSSQLLKTKSEIDPAFFDLSAANQLNATRLKLVATFGEFADENDKGTLASACYKF
jgi:hypothetical protein